MSLRRFFLVLAMGMATVSAAANDLTHLSLEDLLRVEVIGAARYAQPLSEAPSAVSIVEAEDIRRFGHRTLAEALASTRGVYATNDRAYSYLGIRGFGRPGDYNSRILLLVDGISSNDALYNQAMVGHEAIVEMDWIKRIEFVRGPSSATYGSNALFGIVNSVLLSGSDIEGTRLTLGTGNDGMARVGWLSGRGLDAGGDWIAGLSVYRKRGGDIGFPEFAGSGGDGVARGLDGERYAKGFARLSLGNWKAGIGFSTRHKNIPTAYFGSDFGVPGTYTLDQNFYAHVGHSATLGPELTGDLRFNAGAYGYDGEYVFLSTTGVVGRDEARAAWWGAEYQLTWTGLRDHKWLLGAEIRRNTRVHQRYFDISPRQDWLDARLHESHFGLFIQDEWRFAPRWLVNLGVRTDQIQDFGTTASPRAALIYRPVPEAAVKLIHGRAFRPPNAYERYYHDGYNTQKPSPGLQPERIATTELAMEMAVTPAVRLGGSLYRYRLANLVDQIIDPGDGLLVYVNRPATHAQGIELEGEAALAGGWRLRTSLANQRFRLNNGVEPANSPRHLAKLLVDGPLPDTGWMLGLNLQAISRRQSADGSHVPGYLTGNLVGRSGNPASRHGEWSIGIYNLSGRRHLDPASTEYVQRALPRDGREWLLRWEAAL